MEPQVEAVQDADWEEDCACNQETPQALCEACEDVREPRKEAKYANKPTHDYPFFCSVGVQPYLRHVRCTSVSAAGRQT